MRLSVSGCLLAMPIAAALIGCSSLPTRLEPASCPVAFVEPGPIDNYGRVEMSAALRARLREARAVDVARVAEGIRDLDPEEAAYCLFLASAMPLRKLIAAAARSELPKLVDQEYHSSLHTAISAYLRNVHGYVGPVPWREQPDAPPLNRAMVPGMTAMIDECLARATPETE